MNNQLTTTVANESKLITTADEFIKLIQEPENVSSFDVLESLQNFLEAIHKERNEKLGEDAFTPIYTGLDKAINTIHCAKYESDINNVK